MKRAVTIALVIMAFFALSLTGCGKQIEGSCSKVVQECQSIATNESVTVTVTGYPVAVAIKEGEPTKVIKMSDDGNAGSYYVNVSLNEETVLYGNRITVRGRLYSNVTMKNCISIRNAEIVK